MLNSMFGRKSYVIESSLYLTENILLIDLKESRFHFSDSIVTNNDFSLQA